MSVIGIIAEFNPLHKGHEYLLKSVAAEDTVVAVISSNFVQRGEVAIAEKHIRAKAALLAGADLVLELPVLWSMSTAQCFALGGVSILKNIGCDEILFGSECGSTDSLFKTAEILRSQSFSDELKKQLKKGETFAVARQCAAVKLGASADLLQGANNNLAIEYINAAKSLGIDIGFKTVKRVGAEHDSMQENDFVSASLLRSKIRSLDYDFCSRYMSPEILCHFTKENITHTYLAERLILGKLRTCSLNELKNLPDLSEGVENKLFSAIRLATSLEELYNIVKVKRYTHARIRRLALSAFIGMDNEFFMKPPPYIRVLGFNKKGEKVLREGAKKSKIPVITRVSDINKLDKGSKKVFEIECRSTDLFSLFLEKPYECGLEYTYKIIKME